MDENAGSTPVTRAKLKNKMNKMNKDDTLFEEIMNEILDQHDATDKEREHVREIIMHTGNVWDTQVALMIVRAMQ